MFCWACFCLFILLPWQHAVPCQGRHWKRGREVVVGPPTLGGQKSGSTACCVLVQLSRKKSNVLSLQQVHRYLHHRCSNYGDWNSCSPLHVDLFSLMCFHDWLSEKDAENTISEQTSSTHSEFTSTCPLTYHNSWRESSTSQSSRAVRRQKQPQRHNVIKRHNQPERDTKNKQKETKQPETQGNKETEQLYELWEDRKWSLLIRTVYLITWRTEAA